MQSGHFIEEVMHAAASDRATFHWATSCNPSTKWWIRRWPWTLPARQPSSRPGWIYIAEIIKHLYAHLPAGVFDDDEIGLKAGAVFAHLYTSGFPEGGRIYHSAPVKIQPKNRCLKCRGVGTRRKSNAYFQSRQRAEMSRFLGVS